MPSNTDPPEKGYVMINEDYGSIWYYPQNDNPVNYLIFWWKYIPFNKQNKFKLIFLAFDFRKMN